MCLPLLFKLDCTGSDVILSITVGAYFLSNSLHSNDRKNISHIRPLPLCQQLKQIAVVVAHCASHKNISWANKEGVMKCITHSKNLIRQHKVSTNTLHSQTFRHAKPRR